MAGNQGSYLLLSSFSDISHPKSNYAFFRVSINEKETINAKAAAIIET
jgi:hypothetical protein